MSQPLVSVIMSAYNAEKFIEQSIKSVLQQTYSNFELIICDDGSTDGTSNIIKKYPLIHYIYQHNQGQGAGRNRCARNAKGDYLAFIDADDAWTEEKLEEQMKLFQSNSNTAAVYCDMEIVDLKAHSLGFNAKGKMRRGNIFNDLIAGNYMCGLSSLVIKRKIFEEVGGFSDHRYCQDFVFLLKVAKKYDFDFFDRAMVYYLVHDNNITGKIDISYPEQISFYREIPTLYSLNSFQKKLAIQQLKRLYFTYSLLHFRKKNFVKSAAILNEARTFNLTFWKSKTLSLLNMPLVRNLVYNKI